MGSDSRQGTPLLVAVDLGPSEVGDDRPPRPGIGAFQINDRRFLVSVAASIALHAALGCALVLTNRRAPAGAQVIHVEIVPVKLSSSPTGDGSLSAQGTPRPLSPAASTIRPMARPRSESPPESPVPAPAPDAPATTSSADPNPAAPAEPSGPSGDGSPEGSGSSPGSTGSVHGATGGSGSGEGVAIPARPTDLASVHAGIDRTLEYPRVARRNGIQGRTVLEFTLLKNGAIRDLVVRESSGHPILDQAALAAVRRAAPFPPPGAIVSIAVPVVFRLQGAG